MSAFIAFLLMFFSLFSTDEMVIQTEGQEFGENASVSTQTDQQTSPPTTIGTSLVWDNGIIYENGVPVGIE